MAEEWISAFGAFKLVAEAIGASTAAIAICSRAHDGMIEAKAAKLIVDRGRVAESFDDALVPKNFWWASGRGALNQNWKTGDFDTWIDSRVHWRAFGVSFSRSGIEALIGPALAAREAPDEAPAHTGGRPAAAWWDDLWIEISRQLYAGDLQPTKQSDIEAAMMNWASSQGHDPAESTIRTRARKLWTALSRKDEN